MPYMILHLHQYDTHTLKQKYLLYFVAQQNVLNHVFPLYPRLYRGPKQTPQIYQESLTYLLPFFFPFSPPQRTQTIYVFILTRTYCVFLSLQPLTNIKLKTTSMGPFFVLPKNGFLFLFSFIGELYGGIYLSFWE